MEVIVIRDMVVYYKGIGPESGKIVKRCEAFNYVKSHLEDLSDRDKSELIDWFFSGNWVERVQDE